MTVTPAEMSKQPRKAMWRRSLLYIFSATAQSGADKTKEHWQYVDGKAKTRVSGIAGSSSLAKPDSCGQCPVTAVSGAGTT